MLNIVIIALILVGLVAHRYLSTFWEQGQLPYSVGFLIFANSFAVTYLVSFIWMFGAIAGIIVSVLCYLQIVYSAGLWVSSLPWLISMHKNLMIPRVNPLVYSGFSFLVIALALLTIVNFFVSSYNSMWDVMGEDIWPPILVFVGILIVGNMARVAIMSRMIKE